MLPALLLLGLGVLELVLRARGGQVLGVGLESRHMFSLDAQGRLRPEPGWTGALSGESGTVPVRLSDFGLRGPDLGPPAPGQRRVLVLGDSFVFGLGEREEHTLPAQLQARLRDAGGGDVVVGNAGMIGTGLPEQVDRLEQLLEPGPDGRPAFGPDLVVACLFLGNDFVDDEHLPWAVVEGYRFPAPVMRQIASPGRFRRALRWQVAALAEKWLIDHLPQHAMLGSPFVPPAPGSRLLLPSGADRAEGFFVDARAPTPAVEAALARVSLAWERLAAVAGDVPVLLVLVPTRFHLDEPTWVDGLRAHGLEPAAYRFGATQQRLTLLAAGLGLPLVDLTPALADADGAGEAYQQGLMHWTPVGAAAAADALAPHVRTRLEGVADDG